jgi:cell shape-determining protein MreC
MGNLFSNRTRYNELVQEVSDMDNYLRVYDNRLTLCERDVIGFKGRVCEIDKVIKNNPVLSDNIINLTELEERIQNLELENDRLKGSLDNVVDRDLDQLVSELVEQKLSEKEKWQFDLANEFLTLTNDYSKFKKMFEMEANELHETGKITDGDIQSHYTALCYISHKITSNVLKNYFDN